jgi:hypothetical protein
MIYPEKIRLALVADNDSRSGRTLVRPAYLKVGHYTSLALEEEHVAHPAGPGKPEPGTPPDLVLIDYEREIHGAGQGLVGAG